MRCRIESLLVEARDAERPEVERNLHDGAQRRLVALGVELGLLDQFARDVPGPGNVARTIAGAPAGAPRCPR